VSYYIIPNYIWINPKSRTATYLKLYNEYDVTGYAIESKYSLKKLKDYISKDAMGVTFSMLTAIYIIMINLLIISNGSATPQIAADPQSIALNLSDKEVANGYIKTISITNKGSEQVILNSSIEGTIKELMLSNGIIPLDKNQTKFIKIEIKAHQEFKNGEYKGAVNITNVSNNIYTIIPVEITVTNTSLQQSQAAPQNKVDM